MKKAAFLIFVVFLFSASSVFAWGDLCEDASKTPYMTLVELDKFFMDELLGKSFTGKGIVRDVRPYTSSEYTVVVDCLNDILVNVVWSSSWAKDLKVGDEVRFSGRCAHSFRRAYRDTQKTYQLFELQGGDIRK